MTTPTPADSPAGQMHRASALLAGAEYVLIAAEDEEISTRDIAFAHACATTAIAHLLLAQALDKKR
jgi:hypothetical protein